MNLKVQIGRELRNDILPYWIKNTLLGDSSFKGRIDGYGNTVQGAPLSGILVARILWTFSSAYCFLEEGELKQACLKMAQRAEKLLTDKFLDKEYGGSYWSLNEDGTVQDTKKQYYAIAFAVYALSQMHAAGSPDALEHAIALYKSIEEHSFDPVFGGYIEASTRDWQAIEDMRLSDKDRNDAKSMNTHLHILEAYTGLYKVWKDEGLRQNLKAVIEIFLEKIIRPDAHLGLFFDEKWNLTDQSTSYGHDIECSWLLMEAALCLGDEAIIEKTREICARMADAAMEGYREGQGMYYELTESGLNMERHWWVQAEAIVGCLWQWRSSGDDKWMNAAEDIWKFVSDNLLAPDGEWYWSIQPDGSVNREDDRAGFWKCPYHNGRMCMEALEILK